MNTPVDGKKMNYKRLGFLASHRGSNMQAIIDACKDGRLAAVPAVVISNNGASGALDRAAAEGIPAYNVSSRNYPDPATLDIAIRDILIKERVDLVVLAGFMKKIGPATLAAFSNRILNIHPSLLPRHGGPGMYGMNVHAQVLASGDSETGATVHVVADDYDSGPVLARRKVPVHKGDTMESLAARVLEVEHTLYIDTLAAIIGGEISLDRK
jgi:phosphoribosylglycinamide formyltransferase-1